MRIRLLVVLVSLVAGCSKKAPSQALPEPTPVVAGPVQSGIDETAIDMDINPCDDFYGYACGNWLKQTELPVGVKHVDRFTTLRDHDLSAERELLERVAKAD